jgi:cytochrome bd-type quinol oxidase subunit 2
MKIYKRLFQRARHRHMPVIPVISIPAAWTTYIMKSCLQKKRKENSSGKCFFLCFSVLVYTGIDIKFFPSIYQYSLSPKLLVWVLKKKKEQKGRKGKFSFCWQTHK